MMLALIKGYLIMDYEEALDAVISAQEARREIENHELEFFDFALEHGIKPYYQGSEVLHWLGY